MKYKVPLARLIVDLVTIALIEITLFLQWVCILVYSISIIVIVRTNEMWWIKKCTIYKCYLNNEPSGNPQGWQHLILKDYSSVLNVLM